MRKPIYKRRIVGAIFLVVQIVAGASVAVAAPGAEIDRKAIDGWVHISPQEDLDPWVIAAVQSLKRDSRPLSFALADRAAGFPSTERLSLTDGWLAAAEYGLKRDSRPLSFALADRAAGYPDRAEVVLAPEEGEGITGYILAALAMLLVGTALGGTLMRIIDQRRHTVVVH